MVNTQGVQPNHLQQRPISAEERSGVLYPKNLQRYGARWFEPGSEAAVAVESYWYVRWRLGPTESISQRILTSPLITLSIEDGDVPAPFVITGVHRVAWMRQIRGSGEVFGIRLQPAGLALLGSLSPEQVANTTLPITPRADADLHALLTMIRAEPDPARRAVVADREIAARLASATVSKDLLLANQVVGELSRRLRVRTGIGLANALGASERAIQRALRRAIGHGPKWVSRRVRLQEVARVLSSRNIVDVATLAAELGYADQAHLVNDFRDAAGVTPGEYVRALRSLGDTRTED